MRESVTSIDHSCVVKQQNMITLFFKTNNLFLSTVILFCNSRQMQINFSSFPQIKLLLSNVLFLIPLLPLVWQKFWHYITEDVLQFWWDAIHFIHFHSYIYKIYIQNNHKCFVWAPKIKLKSFSGVQGDSNSRHSGDLKVV